MNTHELGRLLLNSPDIKVTASIDISKGDDDNDRRIFTNDCFGINTGGGEITILFDSDAKDNYGKDI